MNDVFCKFFQFYPTLGLEMFIFLRLFIVKFNYWFLYFEGTMSNLQHLGSHWFRLRLFLCFKMCYLFIVSWAKKQIKSIKNPLLEVKLHFYLSNVYWSFILSSNIQILYGFNYDFLLSSQLYCIWEEQSHILTEISIYTLHNYYISRFVQYAGK